MPENILTKNASDVEDALDHFGFASTTSPVISRVTTAFWQGAASAQCDCTNAVGDFKQIGTGRSTVQMNANEAVVGSVYVNMPSGVAFSIQVNYVDSVGGYLANSATASFTGDGAWQRCEIAVPGHTAAYYGSVVVTIGGTNIFHTDGWMLERKSALPASAWVVGGTTNAAQPLTEYVGMVAI